MNNIYNNLAQIGARRCFCRIVGVTDEFDTCDDFEVSVRSSLVDFVSLLDGHYGKQNNTHTKSRYIHNNILF